MPTPPKADLAVFKLPASVVQEVPSYPSVAPVLPGTLGAEPAKAIAAVCIPSPPNETLPKFKPGVIVAQLVPSYSSVDVRVLPPKNKPAV